jgi:glycosyltransferase involved in cell wall biosynthesis
MARRPVILHVIPHAGGGVGAVLRAILAAESDPPGPHRHAVASLEYLNDATKAHCERYGIPWVDEAASAGRMQLSRLQRAADIVFVHWWNHPLMMRHLVDGLPPVRLLVWSHVNGLFPPQSFFPALFELPERFVFTSPASLSSTVVQQLPDRTRARLSVVRSFAGIPAGSRVPCEKSGPFRVGYVGTVEPIKMHPEFLRLCAEAELPAPCVVAGGPAHAELRQQAADAGLGSRFHILGPVADPGPIYRGLHAFAYPLSPRHYGTAENVLVEAMANGAVPVVLSNPPERAIVRHGETGLVVESVDEFPGALRRLLNAPEERDRLARGGHRWVQEHCGIAHAVEAFRSLFADLLGRPKRPRRMTLPQLAGVKSGSPLHLFLSSLGSDADRQPFESALRCNRFDATAPEYLSRTRGTPFHYRHMLGGDPALASLCDRVGAHA